jgi:hypothetical protein
MGGPGPGPSMRGDRGPRSGQLTERGDRQFSGDRRGDGRQWDGRRHRRHFRGGGFAFGFGDPYYDDYYYPYAYSEPACELARVRHVRPNGRVVWRTVQRCY